VIGSLCSGYGGLDLAAGAVFGQPVAWHCEIEDAPSRVLEAHWPGVPNLRDLTEVDWDTVEPVDILTAGYPCGPFSHAGRRKGADDERHLWPHVAEAVRRIRPRHICLENVSGHRTLGFDQVLGDLAALRYDVRWTSIRAADVGAPHGRERVFIIAADPGRARLGQHTGEPPTQETRLLDRDQPASGDRLRAATDWGPYRAAIERWERILGRAAPAPTEPGPRAGQRLSPRFVEWMMGLPAGWVTDVDGLSRNEMLRMLGNGVVPQQAEAALRALTTAAAA
jgi:DNA (cytosine-5)-methyltransferase 1